MRLIDQGACFGMVGFQSCLVLMAPPLRLLMLLRVPVTWLKLRLGVTLLGMITEWSSLDECDRVEVASLVPDHPNVWSLMVALSLIRSLVFLHLELGSLLTSLSIFGMIGGGVMLMLFALRVMFSPVEVSVLFQGLFSLSRRLRCGESFWLCSLLVLYTWVLTIWVLFDMLVV